jgi:putative sugar O-methyltransferase
MRDSLLSAVETARHSEAYRNYLHVRKRVIEMLDMTQKQTDRPSDYWEEELFGFDYMLDASPLIVRKLREHCYHLTGLRSYDYRSHHVHQRDAFAKKLYALRELDDDALLVPESRELGGFGHVIDGALINIDTLKFYESLIAVNKAGLLAPFREKAGGRKVVIEIGAGWGGFAYQFKTLCPKVCYIIVDLPQTLLFSGIYIKTLFPQAKVLLYGDKAPERLLEGYESLDFVLLPHWAFGSIRFPEIDLAINMASFQEMTSRQVDEYVGQLAALGCPSLYSLNRDRSRYNKQLSTVSSIIERYYNIVEERVLDVAYTNLSGRSLTAQASREFSIRTAKGMVHKLLRRKKILQEQSVHEYRHLLGNLKQG